jgi:hypothetical protein
LPEGLISMKPRTLIVIAAAFELGTSLTWAADVSKGIEAFEQRRWMVSIRQFIDVLKQDPRNTQAHEYLAMAIQQLETEKRSQIHDRRLEILESVSTRLENNRMDATALRQSILETTQAETNARQERLHAQCQMAMAEDRLGHLPAANDLVLRILAEDGNNGEAQRLLSDLQSQIHEKLDLSVDLSAPERAALEGFYAYGQADYRIATAAWSKTRTALEAAFPPNDIAAQISSLHFETYEKIAKAHVDEEDRASRSQNFFAEGTELFERHSFVAALDRFRQVALINPDYPQLGTYLVQSEAASEKERTSRLSQKKRDHASEAFAKGLAALEKNQYAEAKQAFLEVLAQDPTHPQARSYLNVIESEMNRRYDPQSAQLHYEAGLVSYASGKLEDAMREWRIATRLDPSHEKAASALGKVQKEIARNTEVPG